MITSERIKVSGGLGITELSKLSFSIKPNQHGSAVLRGRVDKQKYLEASKESLERHIVKINILEEDGTMPVQPIFSGFPKRVTYFEESGLPYVEIELTSGTILLDREIKSGSYQDSSMTYADIIKKAITDISGASVICNVGRDKKPPKPMIQYRETNWEFVKRLASHCQGCIYPEVRQPLPRLWFGFPNTGKKVTIESTSYESGISSQFFKLGAVEAGLKQADFMYYSVHSKEDFNIGDTAWMDGKNLKICQKSGELVRGELVFTYVLGTPSLTALRRTYNPVFAGMSLLGKVLSVKGERVKLHLDIDKEQSEGTAFAYDWIPDTGSVMYCMPQVGTTVSLYFSNEEEGSARAVNCIRMGQGAKGTAAMADSRKKSLTTEHGKELYLGQSNIGFQAEKSGVSLKLEDDKSISFVSSKKISIAALGKVTFRGKTVSVKSPVEMKLYRRK
ncbi:hypothetical protein acsn021_01810 [Anaerocolumna cellulosilytica]|uniref:Uncharacterized protein n=1 Tax=Anaerocolumna cellulosilytica TaxID=433286 RepID=A0A6S6QZB9_9FIRM|nr:hypothetical protein [Anaerocolumna cellulosilytica]MBB5197915.1 hypothetical protein [Anaerocolumna cellulosilytica]BCJ92612.1 hypothetical protein acsn021_01810 [Anaerocolumna cellulosilytica]